MRVALIRQVKEFTEWDYKKLLAMLTRKYGPPATKDLHKTDNGEGVTWFPDGATVTIGHGNVLAKGTEYYLSLVYSKVAKDTEMKKL